MHKLPISVFIITKNEAKRIATTLRAVQPIADEIIVVDSGSTDGTQEICKELGAKVMHHDWVGYGPQKRFAEEQCMHDWVLNLDADEELSEELVQEIQAIFKVGKVPVGVDGYNLQIKDCLTGEKTADAFAHTTTAVRLYNKTRGRYADSLVHDRVQFTDPHAVTHTLHAPVWHHSILSIEQAILKLNRYSSMQIEDMQARGKFPKHLVLRLYTEFCTAFLKSYFLRLDILHGHRGFINSVTYAFSRFARIAKAWEAKQK